MDWDHFGKDGVMNSKPIAVRPNNFTREIFRSSGRYEMCSVSVIIAEKYYLCHSERTGYFWAKPAMGHVCEMGADDFTLMLETLFKDRANIDAVLGLIGNVDHSTGNGENAAKMRGDLLNDIRSILKS